jgi:alginate O-acetyltransferase complex protein AlgF
MNRQHLQLLIAMTFIALGAALTSRAHAGDEGVYGAAAPPDSAYIRVFNDSASPDFEAKIADKDLTEIAPYGASEFVFLPPGKYTLNAGRVSEAVTLKPTRYYTAVVDDHSLRLIDNDKYSNHLKAQLIVYNLIEGTSMSLKTSDGRPVVESIGPNAFGAREVNAVKAAFTLYNGGTKVADVRPEVLERGHVFSLFVTGNKEQPVTAWVVN